VFRNLFKKQSKRKYGGLIAFYGLEEFWDSLLPEEREFVRVYYASTFSSGERNPKLQITTTQSTSGFLWGYAGWAISKKKFELADKLLEEALKRKTNHIDLHFTYNHLIDLCYKRRDEGPKWIERCINYCLEDIKIFPEFKKEYLEEEKARMLKLANSPFTNKKERKKYLKEAEAVTFNLRVPSFQRLAIIYDNQGRYAEAIEICQLALDYGLQDGTKVGFEGRIEKLRKKVIK
jgi:tetratricopeptide (TPR) repeat protein